MGDVVSAVKAKLLGNRTSMSQPSITAFFCEVFYTVGADPTERSFSRMIPADNPENALSTARSHARIMKANGFGVRRLVVTHETHQFDPKRGITVGMTHLTPTDGEVVS